MSSFFDQFNGGGSGYDKYKAKKTNYNGTWFDSNLEARTAEALDKLNIRWTFHENCFRGGMFPKGVYTPDFCLPDLRTFIEVAGVFDERHEGNVRVLADLLDGDGSVTVVDGDGDMSEWVKKEINGERRVVKSIYPSWVSQYTTTAFSRNIFDIAGCKNFSSNKDGLI